MSETDLYGEMHQRKTIVATIPAIVLSPVADAVDEHAPIDQVERLCRK